jgi:hypothetical protein
MNIYYLVLAQIFRFSLRIGAGYLAYVGIAGDMQNELVETMITQITPLILLSIAEGWSYLKNRYFPVLFETALRANSNDSVRYVKLQAKEKSNAPVIY